MNVLKDLSLSAINAGFITVLVGFTSSAVIVFQGAQSLGATPQQIGSWMLALGLGMGLTGIGLSLRYRMPIATAWSTSGAAMLISAAAGVSMNEAIGAFIVSGVLITVCGFTGLFDRIIIRIPRPIAAGMLAGILLQFGLNTFASMNGEFGLVAGMFCSFLVAKRLVPRYAILAPLCLGAALSGAHGTLDFSQVELALATPVYVAPVFSWSALVGVALPLFAVTMASQNVPGLTVLRNAGYNAPAAPLIGWTGATTTALAPFGCYALNLATITAAICVGREAHTDPAKRYVAGVAAGAFYLLVGLFGATVGSLFAAFPEEFIFAIAGLALLGTLGDGLASALGEPAQREAALITFLVTASGVTLLDIGSAFWGMIAGGAAQFVLNGGVSGKRLATPPSP
ncbi:benzoate/H(+) symporter BenE family transporter [Marinobacter sp. SS21]|uniref:benzoate/H(+) symporter BenE family transporter n=1 Tax=Marinobacter sp. SS21 TaxID=2979460 RepID=UPI00232FC15E|nr:benzoate/H(+) symporter BenE family transporter [Marinobacter sp. SS21]MDC0663397.1 benzoate/H(+) symporter BenE family transporter [Marinobacter sp. SS21]